MSNDVTDVTCAPYRARGHTNGARCGKLSRCMRCRAGEACDEPDEYQVYRVREHGTISGETQMMQEIYHRGPISCGMAVTDAFQEYRIGIFKDESGSTNLVHEVSVIGWGQDGTDKFWILKNTWGTYFGEDGFVRLRRGSNDLGIEMECSWAVPAEAKKRKGTQSQKTAVSEAEKKYLAQKERFKRVESSRGCSTRYQDDENSRDLPDI